MTARVRGDEVRETMISSQTKVNSATTAGQDLYADG